MGDSGSNMGDSESHMGAKEAKWVTQKAMLVTQGAMLETQGAILGNQKQSLKRPRIIHRNTLKLLNNAHDISINILKMSQKCF